MVASGHRFVVIALLLPLLLAVGCGPGAEPAASRHGPSDTASRSLLDSVDETDIVKGKAVAQQGRLRTQAMSAPALVAIRGELPTEFEVHCFVTREKGEGPAFIGLSSGSPFLCIIDGFPEKGPYTGISLIDKRSLDDDAYPEERWEGPLLPQGERVEVVCRVGETIELRVGGKLVFQCDRSPDRLSVKSFFVTDAQLTLGSARSELLFEELTVTVR